MATTYKQRYKRYNGTGSDEFHFLTDADIVKMSDGSNVETTLTSHMKDNVEHTNYIVAMGSANVYAVTLNPAPTSYTKGLALCVEINVTNTGASTLNVNGLGAKAILDSQQENVGAGDLVAGVPYTLRYNGTNFILQGKGGVSRTDKQSLIDIANEAELNNSTIKENIITHVNDRANSSLTNNATWNDINNTIDTLTFNNIINAKFSQLWDKQLYILLVDSNNNYISTNKKYDSDGNLILTGSSARNWNCIDDDNNLYYISISSDVTNKTVTFFKVDSSFNPLVDKTIDLSNVLTYSDYTDQRTFNGVIYVNGYIYILISAQDSGSAYHDGILYIIKLTLDGNISTFATSVLGSNDYNATDPIVYAGDYLFYRVYGNHAPNPNKYILRYDITNNEIKAIYDYSNSFLQLIGKGNGAQNNIVALHDNYSTVALRILDLDGNELFVTTDFGVLADLKCIIDNDNNIIGGGYELYNISSGEYIVLSSKKISNVTSLLVDKENNIIVNRHIKLLNKGI